LVVDSSVAVKWFVLEPLHEEALALLDEGEMLVAPAIVLAEVANALWRKVRRGQATPNQVIDSINEIEAAITLRPVDAAMTKQAFDIAYRVGHSIYDCMFLACSLSEEATLVTADAKFVAKLDDELGRSARLLTA
jgi:predicted nucleic acid-binding protein